MAKFRHAIVDYGEDILLRSHSYTNNGILVESTLDKFSNLANNHNDRSIYAWNNPSNGTNVTQGAIKDVSKHKDLNIHIEYISGAVPEQIIVTLSYKHQALTKGNQQPGITLPIAFILTKQ